MKRRSFLKSAAAGGALVAIGARAPAIAQGTRVMKFVPQANLTSLDPIWTTAAVTQNHAYYVYDTLFSIDGQLRPRPQMAEGYTVSDDRRTWTIKLREGLRFHNNEPVRAQDCAPSLQRWAKRDPFGQHLDRVWDTLRAVDDRTLEIKLKSPFPLLLDALAKPTSPVPWIMPRHIAETDPMQQIGEVIGSGPMRFVRSEFVAGSRSVYTRFENYAPRQEQPEWAAGGKVMHFDRIEWVILPDQATAGAALQAGEVDWWEQPLADLLPVLSRNRNITVEAQDPSGYVGMMRFNHLHPPFDNVRLRRALLGAINQEDYMRALMGDEPNVWRTCHSMFPCGVPLTTEAGAEPLKGTRNLDAVRAAIRESGYNGEKVVMLTPTDFATIHPMGLVSNDLLRRLGMNVELVQTDWGTVIQRRASREPADRGGWSIFHTWWPSVSILNPAVHAPLRGNGLQGWFGWATSERREQLINEWLTAPNEDEQKRIAAEIQRDAFENVPYIPIGQFLIRTAYRRNLTGMVKGSSPFPWNLRRT